MLNPQQKTRRSNYVDKRTDEEWLADYYSRQPIRTREIHIRAILLAVEAKARELGVDVDVSDDIVSSALDSGDSGVAIGVGNTTTQKETTLKLYNNGQRTSTVRRNGREIETFSYTSFGASFKWFKESENPIKLDIQEHFQEAAESLGLIGRGRGSVDPSAAKKRMEEQMERDKIQAAYTAQSNDIITQINDYAEALYKFEYQGIQQLNSATNTKPSDMPYPKRKHTGFTEDQINQSYEGAVLVPQNYRFLTTGDVMDDDRVVAAKAKRIDGRVDRINVAKVKVEVLREHLDTYAAHLKVADELHSFEDEPHPLITQHEEKYGEIRELTENERSRTAIFDLSNRELRELINDPEKSIYGSEMIVPAISIDDLGNPDAEVRSGQLFSGKQKLTPKYMSISEKVNVIAGDHTQPIDAIFLAEGVATAATLDEMVRYSPEYEGKNVLTLSAFDVGNFKKAGVALHHKYPDVPLTAVADNDVKVVVDTGNRPILGKDGGYAYYAADKKTILSASDLKGTPTEQIAQLGSNVGAASAKFLNEYFLEHPNRDAEGQPIKPKALAFVANKGQKLTDYLIIPASPDKTGDTPIEERLKSPKQDLNDVVQNQKRVLAYDLKRFLASSVEPVTRELKAAKSKEIMQDLATTLVTEPTKALSPIMDRLFEKNLQEGKYAIEKNRPDIHYENESDASISERTLGAEYPNSEAVPNNTRQIPSNLLAQQVAAEKAVLKPARHEPFDSTDPKFNASIAKSNADDIKKADEVFEKSITNTTELAQKFTNDYVNNDILKAFNTPAQPPEPEQVQNQKPQQEAVNMNRPSPR